MPTRNISLTAAQSAFVDEIIESGEYQNASEAMRDALRALQLRREEDALKLKALRAEIQLGIDDIERGNYVELDRSEIRAYIAKLGRPAPRKRSKRAR